MLKHPRPLIIRLLYGLADFVSILLNDAGERNNVNNSVKLMRSCMVQGISHAGEGLAAAGRHSERVNALRVFGPFPALFGNSPANCVHAFISGLKGLGFQPLNGGLPVHRLGTAQLGIGWTGEVRTADPVGIYQAAPKETGDQAKTELLEPFRLFHCRSKARPEGA